MLVVGGLVWVLSLSTLNSLYQLTLPGWVKARGMSFYLIVFQGGNAIGSALLGLMAELAGLTATLVTAAVALGVGPLIGMRFPFQQIAPESLLPAGDWPAPVAVADGDPGEPGGPAGPVMVSVQYRPLPGQHDQLIAALRDARFSRRRTGASAWRVWRDAADPDRVVEQFIVASVGGAPAPARADHPPRCRSPRPDPCHERPGSSRRRHALDHSAAVTLLPPGRLRDGQLPRNRAPRNRAPRNRAPRNWAPRGWAPRD
jgi:hypothetical protein